MIWKCFKNIQKNNLGKFTMEKDFFNQLKLSLEVTYRFLMDEKITTYYKNTYQRNLTTMQESVDFFENLFSLNVKTVPINSLYLSDTNYKFLLNFAPNILISILLLIN